MRALLRRYDVELVDATAVLEVFPAGIRDGWQLKAYAVANSRFAEVLFLDADQAPVRDPDFHAVDAAGPVRPDNWKVVQKRNPLERSDRNIRNGHAVTLSATPPRRYRRQGKPMTRSRCRSR